jgi:hypothetical protein
MELSALASPSSLCEATAGVKAMTTLYDRVAVSLLPVLVTTKCIFMCREIYRGIDGENSCEKSEYRKRNLADVAV